jgi:hypothetical protein
MRRHNGKHSRAHEGSSDAVGRAGTHTAKRHAAERLAQAPKSGTSTRAVQKNLSFISSRQSCMRPSAQAWLNGPGSLLVLVTPFPPRIRPGWPAFLDPATPGRRLRSPDIGG